MKLRLSLFLFLKTLGALALLLILPLRLAPDEAQYWTWSQSIDWGYYSKPPGVAWEIWLGTKIFGNTELGVRFGALILSAAISASIYFLSKTLQLSSKASLWAAILAALSPFGWYLTFAATTDAGALLLFILATALVCHSITKQKEPAYFLMGFLIGIGALFKWTSFYFWPLLMIGWFFYPTLRSKKIIYALLISCIGFIPSLIWNTNHEWATFRHVLATMTKATGVAAVKTNTNGNPVDFFFSQVGLLSPVLFTILIISLISLTRTREKKMVFCALFPLTLFIYVILSFWNKLQPNWALFLYPPCFVLIVWWGCQTAAREKWVKGGILFSTIATLTLTAIPWVQSSKLVSLPYKLNPFRQNMGWNNLSDGLLNAGYKSDQDFLFSDKYQISSLLSFYSPHQKRAYFFNLSQMRKNQFCYWPSMREETVGKTGYFVIAENDDKDRKKDSILWYKDHYIELLKEHFEKVELVNDVTLFTCNGTVVKFALIFRCEKYLGTLPKESESY